MALEFEPPADQLTPLPRRFQPFHGNSQAETVQKLRAQFPLLRVHGSDQHETGRMDDLEPFALDPVDPRSGHIEQQVDQMIFEQIDLIDIKNPAVRRSQQPRLEGAAPAPQRLFQMDAADHPIFRRPQRQLDHRRRQNRFGKHGVLVITFATGVMHQLGPVGRTMVRTVDDRRYVRQQGRQGPGRR